MFNNNNMKSGHTTRPTRAAGQDRTAAAAAGDHHGGDNGQQDKKIPLQSLRCGWGVVITPPSKVYAPNFGGIDNGGGMSKQTRTPKLLKNRGKITISSHFQYIPHAKVS